MKGRFLIIIMLIILCGTAQAKTVTVDDSGGCDFTSIQDAINSNLYDNGYGFGSVVYDNFTIIVYPGVYNESLKLLYPLSLKAYSSTPADTVIESSEHAIEFQDRKAFYNNGFDYLISGFTIKGAETGIYSHGTNDVVTIENNIITNGNFGIYLYLANPTIKNNTISNNGNGMYFDSCAVDVIGNVFVDNGQGLYAFDADVDVENNLFTNNGLAISSFCSAMQITDNTIKDNTAGIKLGVDRTSSITSNVITGNIEYGMDCCNEFGIMIYNNNFNNEINLKAWGFNLNIEPTAGPNIMGDPSIGGNFWGKPDGTGFSQTHIDADMDGFCDEPYILDDYVPYGEDGLLLEYAAIDYLPLKGEGSLLELILPIANFSSNITQGYAPLSV